MKSLEDRVVELETKVTAQELIIKEIIELLNVENAIKYKLTYPIIENNHIKHHGKKLKNLNPF